MESMINRLIDSENNYSPSLQTSSTAMLKLQQLPQNVCQKAAVLQLHPLSFNSTTGIIFG